MAAIMFCVIRRSSRTFVPLTVRAISSPKILQQELNLLIQGSVSTSNYQYFSTVADAHKKKADLQIINLLKSDIESEKKRLQLIHRPKAPIGFPFKIKIKDIPGEDFFKLTMTRRFGGEKIVVSARSIRDTKEITDVDDDDDDASSSSTDSSNDDENKNASSSTDDDHDCVSLPSAPLNVYISKENNSDILRLYFGSVNYRSIGYPTVLIGQRVIMESTNMGNAWMEFLEIRGIDKTFVRFFFGCLEWELKRYHLLRLEKVHNFLHE